MASLLDMADQRRRPLYNPNPDPNPDPNPNPTPTPIPSLSLPVTLTPTLTVTLTLTRSSPTAASTLPPTWTAAQSKTAWRRTRW